MGFEGVDDGECSRSECSRICNNYYFVTKLMQSVYLVELSGRSTGSNAISSSITVAVWNLCFTLGLIAFSKMCLIAKE